MQASSSWVAPGGTLGSLVSEAGDRVQGLKPRTRELERAAAAAQKAPSLAAALRRPDIAVIAEIKRRSPSKGWIRPSLSASAQAIAYSAGGAAAISVLTEPSHFGGSTDDLLRVREAVTLPIVKKDFHIHPIQLLEARALGASAALLIARAVEPRALEELLRTAGAIGLEVVVEIRNEVELSHALEIGAPIIGINNRDLETLAVDLDTSRRLLAVLPSRVIGIVESGISSTSDVAQLSQLGADAVLVGSSVSASSDPAAAVRALTGISRNTRAA